MNNEELRNSFPFWFILEYFWASHLHIMGLKERLILIMMFIIIKFALCHNSGKNSQCWGKKSTGLAQGPFRGLWKTLRL